MPRIKAGELHLNYADEGEGDPILFIPGRMGLLNAWDFQIPYFSKKYSNFMQNTLLSCKIC